ALAAGGAGRDGDGPAAIDAGRRHLGAEDGFLDGDVDVAVEVVALLGEDVTVAGPDGFLDGGGALEGDLVSAAEGRAETVSAGEAAEWTGLEDHSRAPGPRAPAPRAPQELPEEILDPFDARERGEVGGAVGTGGESAAPHGVVLAAALRVGEHLVGGADLLELLLLGLVAAGLVRVVALGEIAVLLLDLARARVLVDAENLV